jgi:hypothetical protein
MNSNGQKENGNDSKLATNDSGNGSGRTAAPAGKATRRGTGPRTAAGKRRSRYNAVKTGIFTRSLLLKNESPADFDLLRRGYHEHFRPEGMAETELVESLAWNRWRRRRLFRAERAQIQEAIEFTNFDSLSAQALEVWDRSRAGETAGGMLRDPSNPYVIRDAIDILTQFRASFEKYGFRKGEDPWILRKLYGLDHDNAAPIGLLRSFQLCSKLAAGEFKTVEPHSAGELKKDVLESLDAEIERLKILEVLMLAADKRRSELQTTVALIPAQGGLDRIIRYEAHLTREFDRILSQLERLQRIRLGQPAPPTIRLEI